MEEGYEDGEEPLVFHYNREERLKNAPELVQKYYKGELKAFKPGLFRALVSTKGNRFMLFSLVLCVLAFYFYGYFGPSKNKNSLQGVTFSLSAFSYEDSVYASLLLDDVSKKYLSKYEGGVPVTAEFTAIDADGQISEEEILSNKKYDGNKVFLRTTFRDYDIFLVKVKITILDEILELETKVQKR